MAKKSSDMTANEIRRWIGAYTLVLTAVLGAYFTLASGSWLLPMEDRDATSASQILIPFLLGQVVLTYKFFASGVAESRRLRGMPAFFVKAPMLLVIIMMAVALALMAVGGYRSAEWTPSPGQFKALVTFCVALLNSSTVFITARYFETVGEGHADRAARAGKNPVNVDTPPHEGAA